MFAICVSCALCCTVDSVVKTEPRECNLYLKMAAMLEVFFDAWEEVEREIGQIYVR